MLRHLARRVTTQLPTCPIPGHWFHRRGLAALAAGEPHEAVSWFAAAAERYRRELAVEPLARLRVHELMARARTVLDPAGESMALIEIVRRLNRLDRLERLGAPHELADARLVLADWLEPAAAAPGASGPETIPAPQAA
jgi:hypothetical protein